MMFERFHSLWFCICNNYATVFIDVFILQRNIFFRFITIFELLSSNIYFFACILSCIGVYSIIKHSEKTSRDRFGMYSAEES